MHIGVIGCGNICGIYFENLALWPETRVVACADLDKAKAEAAAQKHGVQAMSVEELLADPDIGLILNLTVPKAHFDVSLAAIEAGKHVYVEKPLALRYADGRKLLELADSRGLTIGCAPDTVLGAGIQTCWKLVDEGVIGSLVGGNAFMLCPGHESWHPAPEFYYEKGGGPLFDMGPYYLSTLVMLLGSIRSVQAMAKSTWPTRTISSHPQSGKTVTVETPTHIVAILEFKGGQVVHLTTSFDVQASTLPHVELYGTEGTIIAPDPNGFGAVDDQVRVFRKGEGWRQVPLINGNASNSRGLGVRDQVLAIEERRPLRASGEVGLHVLEAMEKALLSAEQGRTLELETSADRPSPLT